MLRVPKRLLRSLTRKLPNYNMKIRLFGFLGYNFILQVKAALSEVVHMWLGKHVGLSANAAKQIF